MKKIMSISLLAATLAATSAFGQGYLTINTSNGQVFNGLGATSIAGNTALNWGLYWAPAATANPMFSTASSTTGNSTTTSAQAGYTAASQWTALSGSLFQLAFDPNNNQSVIDNVQNGGAVVYWTQDPFSPGQGFAVQGTGASSYAFLEVAWSAAYSTPGAAATAGGAIGWSYVSSFGPLPTDPSAPAAGNQPTFASYGVFAPTTAPVPEPSTLALAGLGGFGMLMAMRRKKA